MTNIILYPQIIKTTTGRSAKHHTQQLTNPQALCNNSTTLAYWGVKTPLFVGNYLRNYPDSLTSKTGSYYTPEVFQATNFTSDKVSDNAIIKKITVEYKYEQISYSSPTAYGRFSKPTISLIHNNNTINTIQGAIPDKNRYNNNKVNQEKSNTNNAELKTLHSHVIYESTNSSFTFGDLKKSQIQFNGPSNTSNNHLRMVMQFIRLNIDFEENPLCRVKTYIKEDKCTVNKIFNTQVSVHTTNGQFNQTKVKINLPSDITITSFNTNYGNSKSYYDQEKDIWIIDQLNTNPSSESILNNYAQLLITCKASKSGEHTITSSLQNNQDSLYHTSSDTINIVNDILKFSLTTNKDIFKLNESLRLQITLDSPEVTDSNDKIVIDTNGLVTSQKEWKSGQQLTYLEDGKWEISIPGKQYIYLKAEVDKLKQGGDFTINAYYEKTDGSTIIRTKTITVFDNPLDKEYFKLRLEDGSDVRYNSLLFTEGDDLLSPLTYDINDDNLLLDNLIVTGESKRISLSETDMINFKLDFNIDKTLEYENVIASIDIIDKEGNPRNDIVIGGDSSINILDMDSPKYFTIDSIKSNESKNIQFMVSSDIEDNCIFKINILGEQKYESGEWIPSKILFKDVPSVKLSIDGIDDLMYETEDESFFTLYYEIQNKSPLTGKDLKFKIIEPTYFKRVKRDDTLPDISIDGIPFDEYDTEKSSFDTHNNIWRFPLLEANSKKYILAIKYQATKRGIYDFIIQTVDNQKTFDDDQVNNQYIHTLMVNIKTNINVTTTVSNSRPYVNDLIDYKIILENFTKPQDIFTFDIYDMGVFDSNHDKKHYEIENINIKYGEFIPDNTESNRMGSWVIKNIGKNKKYILTLSLKCLDTGMHSIEAQLNDTKNLLDIYTNKVDILEKNQRIKFNVYHAVGDNDCTNCNELTEICDDDFIPIGDDFFYVFKITNNERNSINNLTVHARIDKTFINYNEETKTLDGILCSSDEYEYNPDTGLITFFIAEIKKCATKTFCMRIKPSKIGIFYSNFALTTKNSDILSKKLKMTVNSLFSERKLTHELTLYNFERTNRYFRYEIDATATIFKFFNKGDRSLKMIDVENYKKSALETYKGTNLRELYRDIKKNSIYVEPTFLRTGTNELMNKGYELYPDGFIRRFGLLKSEVFHYTGQLPQITNLVEYAMRWDIDNWSTKVWTGDIYTNGVFDLTVDYAKIPTNFDVLEKNNHPIASLQGLVDRVKPFGTKGICYYSATTYLDIQLDVQINISEVITKVEMNFDIEKDIGVISWYNRHDDSLAITYDLIKLYLNDIKADISENIANITNPKNEIPEPITNIQCDVYDNTIPKRYIEECTDIILNLKSSNEIKNFDIIQNLDDVYLEEIINPFPLEYKIQESGNDFSKTIKSELLELNDNTQNYLFTFNNDNEIIDNTEFGIYLEDKKTYVKATRYKDKINNFDGFKLYQNEEEMGNINFNTNIYDFKILMQVVKDNLTNYIHFSAQINNGDFYYFGTVEDYYQNYNKYGILCLKNQEINNDQIYYFTSLKTFSNKILVNFTLKETIQTVIKDYEKIIDTSSKWNVNKIDIDNNSYAIFKNDIKMDKECRNGDGLVKTPNLYFKYDTKDIEKTSEISNIALQLEAQSNKEDFLDDININFYTNGDYYIPTENIGKKRYYPNDITNINQIFNPSMFIHKPNITICNECLRTSRGLYDTCQYCGSDLVTHVDQKIDATFCFNCGWIDTGWSKGQMNKIYATDTSYCTNCGNIDVGIKENCSNCGSEELIYFDYKNNVTYCTCCKGKTYGTKTEYNTVSRCSHCLSTDIERIKIDFNKTYCNDCNKVSNDYYSACPYCFSTNVTHLNYAGDSYQFVENDEVTQMLDDPFVIQTVDRRVKLMTIDIPLNNYNAKLKELKELNLTLIGENHNTEQYFYCLACGGVGLGNYEQCPYCDTTEDIVNINDNNIVMEVFCKIGNTWESVPLQDNSLNDSNFEKTIDLLSLAKKNPYDTFYLYIYVENLTFDKIKKDINTLDISDEKKEYLINNARKMDIVITQIKPSSHYIDESEWNLSSFYSDKRHGLKYEVPISKNSTDYIQFKNFNLEKNKNTKKVLLNIDGINKSYQHSLINIEIYTNKSTYHIEEYVTYGLFNHTFNLLELIPYNEINNDLTININFKNTEPLSEIIITNIDINMIETRNKNIYPITNDNQFDYIENNNQYNIYSKDETEWGLKKQLPHYLSGNELKNNIICCVSFGDLDVEEYIKLYNAKLIVNYESKKGEYYTDYITPLYEDKNAQLITGKIIKGSGEFIGNIQDTVISLNNLEYQINTKDKDTTSSIPLKNELYQSFTANTSSISGITIDAFGCHGYPSDKIKISIYDNENMHPNNKLNEKIIDGWTTKERIYIDLGLDDLIIGDMYWIVIKDNTADDNNYYKIKYNKNLTIGQLITKKNIEKIEDCVLSFAIHNNVPISNYYDIPMNFYLDTEKFRVSHLLYKYNTHTLNTIYTNDLRIKRGMYYDKY